MAGRRYSSLKERFEAHFQIAESGCWLWTASRTRQGYGNICIGSRSDGTRRLNRAHRVAYEIYIGSVPDDMDVCHHCDVPSCVNPEHLFIGTAKDNMADCIQKNRRARTDGSYNGRAKLTPKDIEAIRNSTGSQRKVAKLFGVTKSQIGNIRRGEHWRGDKFVIATE